MLLEQFLVRKAWIEELRALPLFSHNAQELLVASLGVNVLSLALPIVLMQVYDRIVPTKALSTLAWLVVGFVVALGLESVLRLCRSTITNWIAARFDHLLGLDCMTRWLRSRLDIFERDGVGVHLDRLNAVGTLRGAFSGQAFQMLLDLPFAILYVIVTGYLGGQVVAAYLLVIIFAYLALTRRLQSAYLKRRHNQREVTDRRYNFVVEALSGIHTVKSLTIEEQMLRRHERLQDQSAQDNFEVTLLGELPLNIGAMFSQLLLFGILLISGLQVIDGTLTLGTMAACTLLAGRAFQPVQSLASFLLRQADMEIAREQIGYVAGMETEAPEDLPPLPLEVFGRLELRGITLGDGEERAPILKDVTLEVAPRKMVCLAGGGAGGTSAVLHLLLGMVKPEAGAVLIDGHDLAEHNRESLRGRIEFLPQNGVLFNGSILDNITLFSNAHRDSAQDAAALLALDSAISELPQGFETQVGNRLYEFLPSGVVQRICIARALAVRPRVLLMDKVDEAMDQDSRRIFHWLLRQLKGHCTIVMASTDPIVLAMADRVLEFQGSSLVPTSTDICTEGPVEVTEPKGLPGEMAWMRWVMQTARTWEDITGVIKRMDIVQVDEDHRIFTEYVLELNQVIEAFSNPDTSLEDLSKGSEIFQKIGEYAVVHFGREEGIMLEAGCPSLREHQAQHAIFNGIVEKHRREFSEGQLNITSALKLSILDWWVRHINTVDYRSLILEPGQLGKRGADE